MNIQLYRPHYNALLKLGLPIVVGQIGMIVLSFADTLMVGHHSTLELSAASVVNNLFNLIIIFATGFSYGITPLVGQLFGQGRKEEAGAMLKNALLANLGLGVALMAVMGALYANIGCLGQPEELIPVIKPYFLVLLFSLVFVTLFNCFKQFADAITDTRTSMWIMLGGNVLNIVGNWLLIYGIGGLPEIGLLGAGVSTLVSRVLMLVAFAVVFFSARRYRVYSGGFKEGDFCRKSLNALNRVGMPIAAQMGMETASFSLCAIMVGWLGAAELAAHQIMLTIGQLGFMMYYGMAAAVSVRCSNFFGQGDRENIKLVSAAGFHIILVMAAVVSVPLFFLRTQIGAWFTDSSEVAVMVSALVVPFIVYQFGDGLQCNYANVLRGIADVKPVMWIAFIAYFVISLPLGYFFGFVAGWGLVGVWLSFPFGLTSAGLMYWARFRQRIKA